MPGWAGDVTAGTVVLLLLMIAAWVVYQAIGMIFRFARSRTKK